MTDLVGVEKLEKIVNFIASFVDEEYTAFLGADSMADVEKLSIYFSIVVIEREDKLFMEDVYSREGNLPILSNLLWSILHEIGHLETRDEMEDDTAERQAISDLSYTSPDEASHKYHQLYNEVIATDWAVMFALENAMRCRLWDKLLLSELQNFLEVNGVE